MLFLAIQAPLQTPTPHPHDRALLRPISLLGKPKFADGGVSFLRRTEYISAFNSKPRSDPTIAKAARNAAQPKRAAPLFDKESPAYIKEQVEKSFQFAASNLKDSTRVKHPTKRNLKLVDAYPFLPDLDAFPDAGGYLSIKYLTNPVHASSTYDLRLLSSMLRPIQSTDEEQQRRQEALAAHELDPARVPKPDMSLDYDFFLTDTPAEAVNFKRKFDPTDPEHDDDSLYAGVNSSGDPCFRYKRIRSYETAAEAGNGDDKYDEEVAISIHDGSDGLRVKAAHYYPIMQRTHIRPQRAKNINRNKLGMMTNEDDEERTTDVIDVTVEDPDEELREARDVYKEHPYGNAAPAQSQTPEEEDILDGVRVSQGHDDDDKSDS